MHLSPFTYSKMSFIYSKKSFQVYFITQNIFFFNFKYNLNVLVLCTKTTITLEHSKCTFPNALIRVHLDCPF